jgi:hypothetical protein
MDETRIRALVTLWSERRAEICRTLDRCDSAKAFEVQRCMDELDAALQTASPFAPSACSCWLGDPGATFGMSADREACKVHGQEASPVPVGGVMSLDEAGCVHSIEERRADIIRSAARGQGPTFIAAKLDMLIEQAASPVPRVETRCECATCLLNANPPVPRSTPVQRTHEED